MTTSMDVIPAPGKANRCLCLPSFTESLTVASTERTRNVYLTRDPEGGTSGAGPAARPCHQGLDSDLLPLPSSAFFPGLLPLYRPKLSAPAPGIMGALSEVKGEGAEPADPSCLLPSPRNQKLPQKLLLMLPLSELDSMSPLVTGDSGK